MAAYWRTNVTMRQLAPLFRVSKSAADRITLWAGDGGEGTKHWLRILTEIKNRADERDTAGQGDEGLAAVEVGGGDADRQGQTPTVNEEVDVGGVWPTRQASLRFSGSRSDRQVPVQSGQEGAEA